MDREVRDRFELVVFDMDGVLVDSELISARVTARALREAGADVAEADLLGRFLGTSTASILEKISAEHGRAFPATFQEDLRAQVLDAYEDELQPMAGVELVLDRLRVARCVASSSHPLRIRRSLELTGLLDRLAPHLFSATMVERGKPAPDLFLLAASTMAAEPSRCLVIEDSEAGVRAGKAAGMTVLGFIGGSHVRAEQHGPRLKAAGADAVVAEMTALGELLATASAQSGGG